MRRMSVFTEKPRGKIKGGRTVDYAIPRILWDASKENIEFNIIADKFDKLLIPSNRLWKRHPFTVQVGINLQETLSVRQYLLMVKLDWTFFTKLSQILKPAYDT